MNNINELNALKKLNPSERATIECIHTVAPYIEGEDNAAQIAMSASSTQQKMKKLQEAENKRNLIQEWLISHAIPCSPEQSVACGIQILKTGIYSVLLAIAASAEWSFLTQFLIALRFERNAGILSLLITATNATALHFLITPREKSLESLKQAQKRELVFLIFAVLLLLPAILAIAMARSLATTAAFYIATNPQQAAELLKSSATFANFGLTLVPVGFAISVAILGGHVLQGMNFLVLKHRLSRIEQKKKQIEELETKSEKLDTEITACTHLAKLAWRLGREGTEIEKEPETGSDSLFEKLMALWRRLAPETALAVAMALLTVVFVLILLPH